MTSDKKVKKSRFYKCPCGATVEGAKKCMVCSRKSSPKRVVLGEGYPFRNDCVIALGKKNIRNQYVSITSIHPNKFIKLGYQEGLKGKKIRLVAEILTKKRKK